MYAFVHIDKTGGTTLTSILRRSFGTRHCDIRLPLAKRELDGRNHRSCIEAADLRRVQQIYRNLCGISGHNVKAYSNLQSARRDIRFFTILRDPMARFRSQFLNRGKCHSADGFEVWANDEMTHNWQTKMIAGEPNAQKAIELLATQFEFVWFTERYDEGLVMLNQWMKEPGFRPEYRRVNQLSDKRRPHDIARQMWDLSYLDSDPVRTRIQAINAEDQKVYDFVAMTIYPRQVANYRGNLHKDTQQLQHRNRQNPTLTESTFSKLMRNYVYKPLRHCRAL
jgi:Sulfotransferase family